MAIYAIVECATGKNPGHECRKRGGTWVAGDCGPPEQVCATGAHGREVCSPRVCGGVCVEK